MSLAPLAVWFRQMEGLVNAGLPLTSCLEVGKVESREVNEASEHVAQLIASGHRFSSALANYPELFGFAVPMIRVGEETGRLVPVLHSLADYLENRLRMQRRATATLAYPAVLLVVSLGLLWLLGSQLLPAMAPLFNQLGVEMPAFSVVVLGTARLLADPVFVLGVILAGAVAVLGWKQLQESEEDSEVRKRCDVLVLKLPVVGGLLRRSIVARLMRMLAMAMDVGMDLVTCLKLLRSVGGNAVYHERLVRVLDRVVEGSPLSQALQREEVVTGAASSLLAVGEESGQVALLARRAAEFLDEEVELALEQAANLLEPLIVCLCSVVVGAVAIASFLPWFALMARLTG